MGKVSEDLARVSKGMAKVCEDMARLSESERLARWATNLDDSTITDIVEPLVERFAKSNSFLGLYHGFGDEMLEHYRHWKICAAIAERTFEEVKNHFTESEVTRTLSLIREEVQRAEAGHVVEIGELGGPFDALTDRERKELEGKKINQLA